jgi:hypothetical protein
VGVPTHSPARASFLDLLALVVIVPRRCEQGARAFAMSRISYRRFDQNLSAPTTKDKRDIARKRSGRARHARHRERHWPGGWLRAGDICA